MPEVSGSTQITLRLKKTKLKAIDDHRGAKERSDWLRDAIEEKMHRDKTQEALIKGLKDLNNSFARLSSEIAQHFKGAAA